MQLILNEIYCPDYGYLIQGSGMVNKRFIDETMANPLNKAPNNGGEKKEQRKSTQVWNKKIEPIVDHKGAPKQSCSKAPISITRNI